ncbi:unnamed protein product, partial [Allacma fusca]
MVVKVHNLEVFEVLSQNMCTNDENITLSCAKLGESLTSEAGTTTQ